MENWKMGTMILHSAGVKQCGSAPLILKCPCCTYANSLLEYTEHNGRGDNLRDF